MRKKDDGVEVQDESPAPTEKLFPTELPFMPFCPFVPHTDVYDKRTIGLAFATSDKCSLTNSMNRFRPVMVIRTRREVFYFVTSSLQNLFLNQKST
jgi:hypothetical protein